ncbi:phospholipase ABHD3-like [Branchiostoma floridae x Branchiostoma belcheri]
MAGEFLSDSRLRSWLSIQWENWPSFPLVVGVALTVATYYVKCVAKKPLLITGSADCADFLQRRCPVLVQEYYPTVWCFTSRAHTLICGIIRDLADGKPPSYRQDILHTPDGGEIHLDWLEHHGDQHHGDHHHGNHQHGNHHHDNKTRPTVLIMPGLTGNSGSAYVARLARGAHKQGYRGVVFNNRGTNGVELKSARSYCAANTDDLHLVVSHVKTLYPDAPLMAVGVSLGGIILFNYVAKLGKDCGLVAAMVVSVSWNVFEGTRSLEETVNKLLFNRYLAKGLTTNLRRNRVVFDQHGSIDIDHALQASTIGEFDERFTAKVFGYESLQHYYTDASPHNKVPNIQTPILCLNAADDIFSPLDSIPIDEVEKNPNIALVMTSHGGHIGFGDWLFPTRESFMDKLYQQYVDAVFKYGQELANEEEGKWVDAQE